MSGAMKSCDKQKVMEEFIKRDNPYVSKGPLKFDLRSYASFIKDNSLKASDITPEILKRFSR